MSVVPVYSGWSVGYAAKRVAFGSGDLLSFLAVLADISLSKNRQFVKTAFAQACRVSADYEKEMASKGYVKSANASPSGVVGYAAPKNEA